MTEPTASLRKNIDKQVSVHEEFHQFSIKEHEHLVEALVLLVLEERQAAILDHTTKINSLYRVSYEEGMRDMGEKLKEKMGKTDNLQFIPYIDHIIATNKLK